MLEWLVLFTQCFNTAKMIVIIAILCLARHKSLLVTTSCTFVTASVLKCMHNSLSWTCFWFLALAKEKTFLVVCIVLLLVFNSSGGRKVLWNKSIGLWIAENAFLGFQYWLLGLLLLLWFWLFLRFFNFFLSEEAIYKWFFPLRWFVFN